MGSRMAPSLPSGLSYGSRPWQQRRWHWQRWRHRRRHSSEEANTDFAVGASSLPITKRVQPLHRLLHVCLLSGAPARSCKHGHFNSCAALYCHRHRPGPQPRTRSCSACGSAGSGLRPSSAAQGHCLLGSHHLTDFLHTCTHACICCAACMVCWHAVVVAVLPGNTSPGLGCFALRSVFTSSHPSFWLLPPSREVPSRC